MIDKGMSVSDISQETGLAMRTIQRKKAVLRRRLGAAPAAPVPDGFVVSKLTTTVDGDGNTERQSIQAVPEPQDAEHQEQIPEGHVLKGISTLVDRNGEITAQWIKTTRDQELARSAQEAAIRTLAEGLPAIPYVQVTDRSWNKKLLNLITLTDCHVGMQAWTRETGEPWDLNIAERVLTQTFVNMIHAAPDAELCIVNQLGDFLHFDSLEALTPTSRHILDADSRFQKMVEVAVRILEVVIYAAAAKHRFVRVQMAEGNHDMASSVWLRVLFARVFRDHPQVEVERSPNPYVAFQHGETMLGFHHGHLAKKERLPLAFAAQFSKMWGETKHRFIHVGHLHSHEVKEHSGVEIEQHPTLSAKDAYAARNAYHSMRRATCITYHTAGGEIGRQTYLPVE